MKSDDSILYNRTSLNVFIRFSEEEIRVGKLVLDNRQVYFKYDETFLSTGLNLSPFKLKFNADIQLAHPIPFRGIFGVFDDSLPDGWGMLLLNRALQKQGLSLNQINILDQLAFIGDRGKGALIYRPQIQVTDKYSEMLEIDRLKTAMDKVYSGTAPDVIDELFRLGGSSGGARPKVHVGYNPLTNQIIHSRDILPEGFEHWIIKFPSSEDPHDIANIEFAYYKMAKAAQINMSECRLLESKSGFQVFATRRFDKQGNDRLHMHSMAGLTHDNFRLSNIDYGHILDAAYRLEKTAKARETVFRLAAFNVYGHNKDDHSKNFAWLMDKTGRWTFAPAYDLTFSPAGINEHSTLVAGEGARPGRKQLFELAEEFSIRSADAIITKVQESLSLWPEIAKESGVSKVSLESIHKKLTELRDIS